MTKFKARMFDFRYALILWHIDGSPNIPKTSPNTHEQSPNIPKTTTNTLEQVRTSPNT
jgi:hypothetical protein